MSRQLDCRRCEKPMATLRDAKVRRGIVVYCEECDREIQALLSPKITDIPEFLRGFMGK
jgi:hypothetical protein